ncbi:MAG: glutathione S-transferase [Myxococcales bacterium]|nr:glutathione S-transferase [Myxococcales bacterium]
MARIRLYDFPLSGNAHKVRNLLALLGVDYERVPVDLAAGEQRTRAFEDLNPFRQVPVLVDGATVVRDSSAILVYLARKFGRGAWLPVDAEGEARVQEWLATASTAIADGPALARLIVLFGAEGDLEAARERARTLFDRLEGHLAGRVWLAAEHPTIADVACYSYVALAPDGGVPLEAWPRVRSWLERLEKLPGFEPAPLRPEAA